ncbi:TraB/GumN family protein [Acetobacter sp.]|uniref:TraB/GumN family protein n=1 Tax=Acetobacter sp. TaxID=440 RepID=UPI00258596AD|nr:TraB/GumN family protein [Acetobacter sp.]MCC6104711.1 TraB/GumN family protein [Acetobacter sp.]
MRSLSKRTVITAVLSVTTLFSTGMGLHSSAAWGQAATPPPAASSSCPVAAHMPSAPELKDIARTATDRGFLWQVTSDGHSSWLYGTIHAAKLNWAFPGPLIRAALRQSDTIAVELSLSDPATLQVLRDKEDPARLQHLVDTHRKARLDEIAAQQCLPPHAFDALATGMEAAALVSLSGRKDGVYPDYAIDSVIQGYARSVHKPIVPLETATAQRQLLIGTTAAEEDALIDDALHDLSSDTGRKELLAIATMWANSDLNKLEHYREWCDCLKTAQEKAHTRAMLDDRNIEMAKKIIQMHTSSHKLFVAVGALHMSGPNGLPALLRKEGFKVTQIVPAPSATASQL